LNLYVSQFKTVLNFESDTAQPQAQPKKCIELSPTQNGLQGPDQQHMSRINRMSTYLVALLLVLLAGAGAKAQPSGLHHHQHAPLCKRLHDPGQGYSAAYLCLGVPSWALLPALWTPLAVQVNCSTPQVRFVFESARARVHARVVVLRMGRVGGTARSPKKTACDSTPAHLSHHKQNQHNKTV
jgi:hypothetical protein